MNRAALVRGTLKNLTAEARRRGEFSFIASLRKRYSVRLSKCIGYWDPGFWNQLTRNVCAESSLWRKLDFGRQVPLPVEYEGVKLDCGYRMDLVVKTIVVVELKCVDRLLPVHEAQLLTYMKLAKLPIGLMLNFHAGVLTRGGVIRRVLSEFEPKSLSASASPR